MEPRTLTFDDGASTTIESWGSQGRAIVCVHGMTSSRKAWVRLAARFDGRCRVIAYDQRGHGDSADVHGPMQLERSVADLRAVLRATGPGAVALVGHSWGGAVALLAGRDAAEVRGTIAIDPVLRVVPGTWRDDYLDDAEALFALPRQARELSIRSSLQAWHPLDIDGKLHAVREMTAEPIARLGSDNRVDAGGWDILAAADAYPKPLLVLAAGPDDSVMSAADIAHLEAHGGPNVRVRRFEGEGHNLHRTAFDAFAAEVEAFLAAIC